MKQFINSILSFLLKVSYSEDCHYKIFSFGKFKLQFKRHSFNWYKSVDDDLKIEQYLTYKKSRKAKSVVYTCIINDYDDIYEIKTYKYIDKNWDYILFTDNKEHIKQGQIGIWEVRPLQYTELDTTRNNRWHKLNPHQLFPEYDESIYIDANIVILTSCLYDLIAQKNSPFVLSKHYKNKCIYAEYKDVKKMALDDEELINKELTILENDGMPKNYGFCENNILYRKHNDDIIKKIDEEWWSMVKNYAKRDQLALCYLLWKYGFKLKDITFKNSRLDHKNFFVMFHKKNRKGDLL